MAAACLELLPLAEASLEAVEASLLQKDLNTAQAVLNLAESHAIAFAQVAKLLRTMEWLEATHHFLENSATLEQAEQGFKQWCERLA